jgi:predicted MFS family arabinose efflux permease
MTWMLAHNILYTYVAPFVAPTGLAERVDLVLLVFGIAALAGIWMTGRLVDRHLRTTVLASLAGFAIIALLFGLVTPQPVIIVAGVAIWGLTFGGAATLLQTALADTAGDQADVALSMNVVTWNLAIAGGGVLGGLLLDHLGAASFPWAMLTLLIGGLVIAWSARGYGFPAGPRRHSGAASGH